MGFLRKEIVCQAYISIGGVRVDEVAGQGVSADKCAPYQTPTATTPQDFPCTRGTIYNATPLGLTGETSPAHATSLIPYQLTL